MYICMYVCINPLNANTIVTLVYNSVFCFLHNLRD